MLAYHPHNSNSHPTAQSPLHPHSQSSSQQPQQQQQLSNYYNIHPQVALQQYQLQQQLQQLQQQQQQAQQPSQLFPSQSYTSSSPALPPNFSMVLPQTSPPIRLQQSTPQPTLNLNNLNSLQQQQQQRRSQSTFASSQPEQLLSPFALAQTQGSRSQQQHSRNSSVGSSSPFSQHGDSFSGNNSPWSNYTQHTTPNPSASRPFSLPTPADTPVQFNFLANQFAQDADFNFTPSDNMKRGSWGNQTNGSVEDDAASYTYSGAPSVSSVGHNSPPTPQNINTDWDFDVDTKSTSDLNTMPALERAESTLKPSFERTDSAAQEDALLFDQPSIKIQPAPRSNATKMSAQRQNDHNLVASMLQAAQQGHMSRSHSPVIPLSRNRSPFRPESEMSRNFQQQQEIEQLAMRNATRAEESKTISPKEAMLDFTDDDADMASMMPPAPPVSMNFPSMPYYTQADSNFTNPYMQMHKQIPQAKPFPVVNFPRGNTANKLEETFEFPTTLTTMESTASEASAPTSAPSSLPSSQQSTSSTSAPRQSEPAPTEVKRPADIYDAGGTYSCTYHNCTLRFETPAKLQRHKRDAHRHTSPSSQADPTSLTNSADNTQAGPHECHRLKPNGEPCNSVFSRPYDLTRHEDTIHNPKKQKVQCHLCTEEKSFSRADALGRHMRAVHPEVDWPAGRKVRRNARK